METKRLSFKHKNNKLLYYAINYLRWMIPSSYYKNRLKNKLKTLSKFEKETIISRVNFYNKLDNTFELNEKAKKLSDLNIKEKQRTYIFDLYEYSRFFNQNLKGHFLFGDIIHVPNEPSLTKSRPISDKNQNSVILKWNKIRHFTFVGNDIDFLSKKDMLVWRGKVHSTWLHRILFVEMYFKHPLCDIGRVNTSNLNPEWKRSRMTISEQLDYKFILSIEGKDVASNLKWIMSSNSIAVMPSPKFETWFMESLLIPDYHYILIKDDYSDLEYKLNYYMEHPDEAQEIIKNAHDFVKQFKNKKSEDLISLLVLKKYFEKTGQLY